MELKRLFLLFWGAVASISGFAFNFPDSISLSLYEETQDNYVFCVCNNTNDTIYLYDGYLNKCLDGYIYTSMYFHRYDKKARTYKLSLLPILPELNLRGCCYDVLTSYKDKIIQNGRLTFTFMNVAPNSTLLVTIEKEAFRSLAYVDDFHAESLSCSHHLLFLSKMEKRSLKRIPSEIFFELGAYKKVDNLLKWCGDVSNDDVDNQATAMIVLSIPVYPNR